MDKHVENIVKFLKSLNPRQRVLLAASAAGVVLTLLVFVKLFSAPPMTPLFTGLSPTDSQAMEQRLAARGVSYQVSSDGGTILVPADQLDKLRMQMSTLGPPATGRMGWKLFDQPNWSGSDFSEKVNYQRALEGELEETIDTISEVEESRVHLVLPHDSLFTDEQRQGKAAVVLRLRGRLSNDAIVGIERLVSGAVDDLPPKNVTIIDADTGAPLVARESDSNGVDAPRMEAALEAKIVDTLAPVVGANHVRASVTVERDPSSAESTQEVYDPANPVVLTSQISRETSATEVAQGVPGTSSNVPKAGAKPPAADQAKTETLPQGTLSESKTYAVSKTVSHTIEPAGRIERIEAAVIVDDATETKTVNGHPVEERVKRTPQDMQQIDALTKAAIGFDAKRGDQVVVQDLSFLALPVPQMTPLPLPERVRQITNQWMSVLRIAGLLLLFVLVYLMLLRPLQKMLMAGIRQAPQPAAANAGAGSATAKVAAAKDEEVEAFETELEDANSEVKRVVMLKRNLVDKVKNEPEASSRLLENWIRQGKAAS
jgi:flagellar M-ring protein FliF